MANKLARLSRQSVEWALEEFVSLGREQFLAKYRFGKARDFFVVDPSTGTCCDSKAVLGAAYGLQFPEEGPLTADAFSGRRATVVKVLRSLGFEMSEGSEGDGDEAGRGWSAVENELIVADYLDMLAKELAGQTFNKAERARTLIPLLNGRSKGSIEFKRANISAVLLELGVLPLKGYKPRSNFQRDGLVSVVIDQLQHHPSLEKAAALAVEMPATVPEVPTFSAVKTPAPVRRHGASERQPAYVQAPIKRDYVEREARNRSLGDAGERFIVSYEQWRLSHLGLGRLADKVKHVAEEHGDGLGYDVLSFETDGSERYIEVKTTAHEAVTPFFVSANELAFARAESERFRLYRLYHFRTQPRFFELAGSIEQHCRLDPSTFRASFG